MLFTIIVIALLAFILGDFLTSGRTYFGKGNTIAKVAGHKISVQDFQKRLEIANNQMQNSGQRIDSDNLQQQLLSQMLLDAMMDEELDALGIVVTDKEVSQVMLAQPQMVQLFDAIKNPAKYQLDQNTARQLREQWKAQEDATDRQLRLEKFGLLFDGVITANQIDAKSLYDDNNITYHLSYAHKELSSLADDQYPVSDEEIQAQWEKDKTRYSLEEEQRTVNYIVVNIEPSDQDNAVAEKEVEDALMALRECKETEAVAGNVNFTVDRATVTKSLIKDVPLKNFVDSATQGQVGLVSKLGNTYTLAKVIEKGKDVDSINVSMVQATDSIACDSIVTALMAGAKITDFQSAQDSVWTSLIDPGFPKNMKEKLLSAEVGKAFVFDTLVNGSQLFAIYRVNQRKAPVETYDLAVMTRDVEPSSATENKLTSDLRQFLAKNTTASEMAKNAASAGYTLMPATVTKSNPHIGNLADSRSAVKWAMEAKEGQVSDIFTNEDNSRLLVVAVKSIYNGKYIPASDPDVNRAMTTKVRNGKKAAELLSKYQGQAKSVEGYAQLMESVVDSTEVTFGQMIIMDFGLYEYGFAAQVATAEPNTLVGPIQTNSSVVAFNVYSIDKQGRPYNYYESSNAFDNTYGNGLLANNLFNILRGRSKVENNLLDFYGGR